MTAFGIKINITQSGFTTLYSLLWPFFSPSPDLKKLTPKPSCEPLLLLWAPGTLPAMPSGKVISSSHQLIPSWLFVLFLSSCSLPDQWFWESTTEQRTFIQISVLESVSRRWSHNSVSGKGTSLERHSLFFFLFFSWSFWSHKIV